MLTCRYRRMLPDRWVRAAVTTMGDDRPALSVLTCATDIITDYLTHSAPGIFHSEVDFSVI